jgi:hypothetical protein
MEAFERLDTGLLVGAEGMDPHGVPLGGHGVRVTHGPDRCFEPRRIRGSCVVQPVPGPVGLEVSLTPTND